MGASGSTTSGDARHRAPSLEPGLHLDHFRIVRLLGRGGMGEVYLARDTLLERKVALKIINARLIGSEDAVFRFIIEARTTARFNHPHIVQIYAVGRYQGSPYVALEYLEGRTLRQRLVEGPLPLGEVLGVARAIAEALQEAHSHEVLHRDLKPENVILPHDGRLRVLDFGLAKALQEGPAPLDEPSPLPDWPQRSVTAEGGGWRGVDPASSRGLRGTPAYMAPEQWGDGSASKASDLWAFGLILYELVSGRHPYHEQTTLTAAVEVASEAPVPGLEGLDGLPPALSELIRRCLDKDPAGRPSAAAIVDALEEIGAPRTQGRLDDESPFRGPFPYAERHADLFFGRTAELAAGLERLDDEPLLLVCGPPAAGKTSLVCAGLLPRLRRQGRQLLLSLHPGPAPWVALARQLTRGASESKLGEADDPAAAWLAGDETALAAALAAEPSRLAAVLRWLAAATGGRVLLFVDRLEELLELPDESSRRSFLRACWLAAVDPAAPVRVVAALRDCWLEPLTTELAACDCSLPAAGPLQLLPPGAGPLSEALGGPLAAVGYRFDDPDLVTELVDAVRGEVAGWSLLQNTVRMLWDRRDRGRRVLLSSAYAACGGVAGALAEHAEAVWQGLAPAAQQQARALMLRLVTPLGARHHLGRGRLLDGLDAEAAKVLDRLVESRLLTLQRAPQHHSTEAVEVELVHDSLLSAWPRLRGWLDEDPPALAWQADLVAAAELWARRGHRPQEVWHGEVLWEVEQRVAASGGLPLPGQVLAFLAAGRRREHELLRRRRVRLGLVAAGLLLVGLLTLLGRQALDEQQQRARQQQSQLATQRAAELLDAALAANERGEPLEARARLRSSLELQDSLVGRALWLDLAGQASRWRVALGSPLGAVAFSRDGGRLAVGRDDGTVELLQRDSGRRQALRRHRAPVRALAFFLDDRLLASGDQDGTIGLWNPETGEALPGALSQPGAISALAMATGGMLVSSAADGVLRGWEVQAGTVRTVFPGHVGPVRSVAATTDGRWLISTGDDLTVRLWEAGSGRLVRQLTGHSGPVRVARFSPDGLFVASAGDDRTIRLWNVHSGGLVYVITGHGGPVRDLAFTPDGRALASAGGDGTVRLWEVSTARQLRRLDWGGAAGPAALAFSPDGGALAVAGLDGVVELFDRATLAAPPPGPGRSGPLTVVAFSPDGQTVIAAGAEPALRLRSVASGEERPPLPLPHVVTALAVDRAGFRLATGGADGSLRLWQWPDGRPLLQLTGLRAPVSTLAFSPDGQWLAAGCTDGTVPLYQMALGDEPRAMLRGHAGPVTGLQFSADARLLASSASGPGPARLWDVSAGVELGAFGGEGSLGGVALSGDGASLYVAGQDGTLAVFDLLGLLGGGGRPLVALDQAPLGPLAAHPDGRRLGIVGLDGQAWLWGPEARAPLLLVGHAPGRPVRALAFAPDGATVATAAEDGTVRLWDTERGTPRWRSPLLVASPPALLGPAGWQSLAGVAVSRAPAPPWRTAAASRSVAGSLAAGGQLACLEDDDGALALWHGDEATARQRWSVGPGRHELLALPDGCAVRSASGEVRFYPLAGGRTPVLALDAGALAAAEPGLWIAGAARAEALDEAGRRRASYSLPAGVTALAPLPDEGPLVCGFADGGIVLHPRSATPVASQLSLSGTPASPVLRLLPVSDRLLAAGFADGTVGLWELQGGRPLRRWALHGPAIHLARHGDRLLAASELGDHREPSLATFLEDRCPLLRELWRAVPMAWEGEPTLRAPPRHHPCAPSEVTSP